MPLTSAIDGPAAASPGRVERYETVVVGAGQAGLAAGHHLASHDVDFSIVSDERRVGDNWRRRWDSLRLFTPARYSSLPGMPFPAHPYHLPDKDEMADYLERYAERFELPVRPSTRALSLRHDGTRFVLRTSGGVLESDSVIVATGAFQSPRIPDFATRLSPTIAQIHSSQYVNHWSIPEGPVLVVGAGNSGAQIAIELARFRPVWLAGRDTGHLPRRVLGRDLFDWIWPLLSRATTSTALGRRMRSRQRAGGGDALLGMPEGVLQRAGVQRVGRVTGESGGRPVAGGMTVDPAVIIWCTGFHPDFRWVELPVFEPDGYPRHSRGVVDEVPGLYFLGLRFLHRMASSLVGGVGADARHVVEASLRSRGAAVPG
jgi:putative flavoprotein involved in K+ transport